MLITFDGFMIYLIIGMGGWLLCSHDYLYDIEPGFSREVQLVGKVLLTLFVIVLWPLYWSALVVYSCMARNEHRTPRR